MHQRGYYTTHDIVLLKANLYDVGTGDLFCSARSESFDLSSAREVVDGPMKLVINDLQENGLIKPKV